eukprot:scaffold1234_cov345-Pavlova_lutheri.AAC.5
MPLGFGGELSFEVFHLAEKLFSIDNFLTYSMSLPNVVVKGPPQLRAELCSKHYEEEMLPEPMLGLRGT